MSTPKLQIILAVLRDLYDKTQEEGLLYDISCIEFKDKGWEELVEDYSKQIIDIMSKE